MTLEDKRFRPVETAPEWSGEVFDICAELTGLLETHSYRFARTMPGAPHSYTLKRTWHTEDLFVEALRKMRAVERVEEFFKGWWYRRFTANGYKYWTMGANLDHILINRAIHDSVSDPYAAIADSYDLGVHKKESDVERSKRVYESLKIEPNADILDIGCGTGTLADFRFVDIYPERYVGIDPSRGMLGVFADKHSEFRNRLIRTRFEDYWPKPGQKFDLVAASVRRAFLYLRARPCIRRKSGGFSSPAERPCSCITGASPKIRSSTGASAWRFPPHTAST